MGGITLGIPFLHQLRSLDVHTLMRGRLPLSPYRFPVVHPVHDGPLTLYLSLRIYQCDDFTALSSDDPHAKLTRWLRYLDGLAESQLDTNFH